MNNYVKFQRGTVNAYNALKEKQRLDNNTLYFIYSDSESEDNKLYLGDKLIGCSKHNNIELLEQVSDINLTDLKNKDFLIYEASSQKWINISWESLINNINEANKDNILFDKLSDQFSIITQEDGSRELNLSTISTDNVSGLSELLDKKVDKEEGSRLITSNEVEKLSKLIIEDDGSVNISGQINASGVIGLKDFVSGVLEDIQNVKDADENYFTVSDDGILNFSESYLQDQANKTSSINSIGNLSEINDRVSEDSTLVQEINYIKNLLTWEEIEELEVKTE